MAATTGLFLVFTLFTAPLFSMIAFTPAGGGYMQQASAQEQSTLPPSPTLPFTPFSLQQQEAVPEEGGGQPIQEPGVPPPPATNDTEGGAVTELTASSASEPPLIAEIITNATQAVAPVTIRFGANITGGAPPYSYNWYVPDFGVIDQDRSITQMFFEPGTFTYILTAIDSRGKTVNDGIQIVIRERLSGGGAVAPEPGGIAPPGEGVPLTVEIIPNATQGFAPATFQFDSKVTGGTEPYNYRWKLPFRTPIFSGTQLVARFDIAGTYTVILNVTDSTGRTGSDSVEITVGGLSELPPSDIGEVVTPPEGGGVLPPPETAPEGGQLPGGGLLPGIAPGGEEGGGETVGPTEEGVLPPPETAPEGDTGEEGTPRYSLEDDQRMDNFEIQDLEAGTDRGWFEGTDETQCPKCD